MNRSHYWLLSLLVFSVILSGCRFVPGRNPSPAAPEVKNPSPSVAATAAPAVPVASATTVAQAPTLTPTIAFTATPLPSPSPTQPARLQFTGGKNIYFIELERTRRQFIIYVPKGYSPNRPTPLLFMYHGSNQSGEVMYENTAWKEKAEAENFIVVYPTSWKYRMLDSNQIEDKWNTSTMQQQVVPGSDLKDDVKFTRAMLDLVNATFNIDSKRIYASGFSNGAGFVLSRLILEMNDIFASYTIVGGGLFDIQKPEVLPKGINTSLYSIIGSNDEKISEGTGTALPFPIIAEEIARHPLFKPMLANTTSVFSLDPAYSVVYDQPFFTTMTFNKSLAGWKNQYVFRMVNNIGHVYPNGINNRARLNASDLFWDFYLRNPKP